MWNLDVGIILIYCKIYFLWGWTFENSQRLTFNAFFWELVKIYSFMITTSLNAFAPQTCKAGLDWCCQHVNTLANDQSKKNTQKPTLIEDNWLLFLWAEFCQLKKGSTMSQLNHVKSKVRQIKTLKETHLAMCLALSSMVKLWINAFEVWVRAFYRNPSHSSII